MARIDRYPNNEEEVVGRNRKDVIDHHGPPEGTLVVGNKRNKVCVKGLCKNGADFGKTADISRIERQIKLIRSCGLLNGQSLTPCRLDDIQIFLFRRQFVLHPSITFAAFWMKSEIPEGIATPRISNNRSNATSRSCVIVSLSAGSCFLYGSPQTIPLA